MLVLTMDALVRTGLSLHPTHMMSTGAVRLFLRRLAPGHQFHSTFGALAWLVGDDFGMHKAGVRWGWRGR